jgi:hypothetical protein
MEAMNVKGRLDKVEEALARIKTGRFEGAPKYASAVIAESQAKQIGIPV